MKPYLLAAAILLVAPLPALAGTVTMLNSTDIVAYAGNTPTPYYSGANPYVGATAIGSDFTTKSLTVEAMALADGDVSVEFSYLTQFSGSQTIEGVNIAFADIFLRPDQGAGAASPFSYGISVGDQGANGGLSAGFYSVQSDATSQQILGGRSNLIYGGAYTDTRQFEPGQAGYAALSAPTVITAGQRLGDAAIALASTGHGLYRLSASITMTAQEAALFNQGYDVFWGTGDCANGAFLAEMNDLTGPGLPVMEPASFVLLAGFISLGRLAGLKTPRGLCKA